MTITSWLPLVLYAAAAVAYFAHFSRHDPRTGHTATALLGSALLAHAFLIGMQTMEAGYAPLVGTTAAISAFVWLLGIAYLYVELTMDERAMGVFVTALLAVLAVLPRSTRRWRRARRSCAVRSSPSTCCRCSSRTRASRWRASSGSPTCCSSRKSRRSSWAFSTRACPRCRRST